MLEIRMDDQGIPQVAAPTATPAPESRLKARHMRFRRNGRRLSRREEAIRKDDDDETTDSDDETSSSISTSSASSSSVTSISATTTSTISSSSTTATAVKVTSTSVQVVVAATTTVVSVTSSVATLSSTILNSSTKTSTPTLAAQAVAAATMTAASTSTKHRAKMSSGMEAALVLVILGFVALAVFAVWFYMRTQRKHREAAELEYETEDGRAPVVMEKAQNPVMARLGDFRSKKNQAESTIWGSETRPSTAYTEASFIPPPVPASMQPGGLYNDPNAPSPRQDYGIRVTSIGDSPLASSVVSPPRVLTKDTGTGVTVDADGFVRPPSRWFSRMSQVSVPRYKDVTSWVHDARSRVADVPPAGTHEKM